LPSEGWDPGAAILTANEALDRALDAAPDDLVFVSDSSLPPASTGKLLRFFRRRLEHELEPRWQSYYLLEKDPEVIQQVREFHEKMGERIGDDVDVVAGTGSAALLATVLTWARDHERSDRAAICSPPYVKVLSWLERLEFDVDFVYAPDSIEPLRWTLPEVPSFAVLTDPLWFAGRRLSMGMITELREWQDQTGSLVFVDGTFQYMPWREPLHERAALLDSARTIRLVCPTKSLAAHGFRFAYLLAPSGIADELRKLYRLMHGAASIADGVFAKVALRTLLSPISNRGMLGDAEARASRLEASPGCERMLEPESGYFVLVKPSDDLLDPSTIGMDQHCFGLCGYPGFVRVNVLNDEALMRFGADPDRKLANAA